MGNFGERYRSAQNSLSHYPRSFTDAREVMDFCHKLASKLDSINEGESPQTILEVSEDATTNELQAAHARLTGFFNPDRQTHLNKFNLYLRSELEFICSALNQALASSIKDIVLVGESPIFADRVATGDTLERVSPRIPYEASYVGKVFNGRFRIDAWLGRGGMGIVYRATDLIMDRRVAIKLLPHDRFDDMMSLQRFQREAHTAALIEHQNVVTIYDFDSLEDVGTYIVMEYIKGYSLGYLLSRRILSFSEAMPIIKQILSGVAAAHKAGVVHRDLKPENIMLKEVCQGEYTVKILDFGLAKMIESLPQTNSRLSSKTELLGTPFYMSPEQCITSKVDEKSDIYSLGIIFYEMFTGDPPFLGSPAQIMRKHMSYPVCSLRALDDTISEPLDALILTMLSKRKEDRPDIFTLIAQFDELDEVGGPFIPQCKIDLRRAPQTSDSFSSDALSGAGN